MRKSVLSVLAFLLVLGLSSVAGAQPVMLSFQTMYGVDGPFVNHRQVRGVLGDELPWEVGSANGTLTTDGHLVLSVRGIVFANDPEVPPGIRGTNDEATFRALVSCLAEGPGKDHVSTVNVLTPGFTATTTGDSDIDTVLTLPNPCVAPIVFVMSGSENKWFAVTGAEVH